MTTNILVLLLIITLSQSIRLGEKPKPSVIVIGAGVSGISAAYTLQKQGFHVTILEARERPLGRVKTETKDFGYPVDYGAIWVDFTKPGNPFEEYMKEFKTEMVPVNASDMILFSHNSTLVPNFTDIYSSLAKNLRDFLLSDDIPLFATGKSYLEIFIKRNGNLTAIEKEILEDMVRLMFGPNFALPMHHLFFAQQTAFDYQFTKSKGFYMLPHGYSEFFNHFVKGMKIIYNTFIYSIESQEDKAIVKDMKGNSYTADYVICTLPIGILKKNLVYFSPTLSQDKYRCLSQTTIEKINKVMVEFEENFWGKHFLNYYTFPDSLPWLGINFNLVNKKNILIFIINDGLEYHLADWHEDKLSSWIYQKMQSCHPGKNVKIRKLVKTNWENELFTHGAFTWRVCSDRVQVWSKPEGRIYFAGEHTAERHASTQGAWISGQRAAEDIILLHINSNSK